VSSLAFSKEIPFQHTYRTQLNIEKKSLKKSYQEKLIQYPKHKQTPSIDEAQSHLGPTVTQIYPSSNYRKYS
jgi:hypothetical protein